MKKILFLSLVFLLLGGVATAAGLTYKGYPVAKLLYNSKELVTNVPPINLDGSIVVPLSTLRLMGLDVAWNNATKTVSVTQPNEGKTPPAVTQTVKSESEIQALDQSVCLINELENGQAVAQGSGVVINSHGLLATAAHVADQDGRLVDLDVRCAFGTYRIPAGQYVAYDTEKDIFLAYLPGATNTPFIPIETELPKFKDTVYALGNKVGTTNYLSSGKVIYTKEDDISSNAVAYPGMSGGAMINLYGNLIGIINKGWDDGIIQSGDAIPISEFIDEYVKAFNQ